MQQTADRTVTAHAGGEAADLLAAAKSAAESGTLAHHELEEILAGITRMIEIDAKLRSDGAEKWTVPVKLEFRLPSPSPTVNEPLKWSTGSHSRGGSSGTGASGGDGGGASGGASTPVHGGEDGGGGGARGGDSRDRRSKFDHDNGSGHGLHNPYGMTKESDFLATLASREHRNGDSGKHGGINDSEPKGAVLSLDEVPYDRDLKWMNEVTNPN